MPELPEVEVVKNGLEKAFKKSAVIKRIEFLRANLRSKIPKSEFLQFIDKKIDQVYRRAKYLVFLLGDSGFVSSLGMTGTWRFESADEISNSERRVHDHIRIHFYDARVLTYNDPRRFGSFQTLKKSQSVLQALGPEPLTFDFNTLYLKDKIKNSKAPIKNIIMNQKIVVGVGNIYASESLFLAGIHPRKSGGRLTLHQIQSLVESIKNVLSKAISMGGSTIGDYFSLEGLRGNFQSEHFVYGQEGLPCRKCQSKIKMLRLAGRSTFWCPTCQKYLG